MRRDRRAARKALDPDREHAVAGDHGDVGHRYHARREKITEPERNPGYEDAQHHANACHRREQLPKPIVRARPCDRKHGNRKHDLRNKKRVDDHSQRAWPKPHVCSQPAQPQREQRRTHRHQPRCVTKAPSHARSDPPTAEADRRDRASAFGTRVADAPSREVVVAVLAIGWFFADRGDRRARVQPRALRHRRRYIDLRARRERRNRAHAHRRQRARGIGAREGHRHVDVLADCRKKRTHECIAATNRVDRINHKAAMRVARVADRRDRALRTERDNHGSARHARREQLEGARGIALARHRLRLSLVHHQPRELLKTQRAEIRICWRRVEPHAQRTRRRAGDALMQARALVLKQHDLALFGRGQEPLDVERGDARVRLGRNDDRVLAILGDHHRCRAREIVVSCDAARAHASVFERVDNEASVRTRAPEHAHMRAALCRGGGLIRTLSTGIGRSRDRAHRLTRTSKRGHAHDAVDHHGADDMHGHPCLPIDSCGPPSFEVSTEQLHQRRLADRHDSPFVMAPDAHGRGGSTHRARNGKHAWHPPNRRDRPEHHRVRADR